MKPVFQNRFGKGEGNCLAACLASIFEVPIESIPEFAEDPWYNQFEEYMISTFGLQPAEIVIDQCDGWKPKGFHLISGNSPRGDYKHAVVGKNGEPVHDPYEGGFCRLESMDTYTIFISMLETVG